MAILNSILKSILHTGNDNEEHSNFSKVNRNIDAATTEIKSAATTGDTSAQVAQLVASEKESNVLLKASIDIQTEQITLLNSILNAIKEWKPSTGGIPKFDFKNPFKDFFKGNRNVKSASPIEEEENIKGEKLKPNAAEGGAAVEAEEAVAKKGILGTLSEGVKTAGKWIGKVAAPIAGGIAGYEDYKDTNNLGHAASVGVGTMGGVFGGEAAGAWVGGFGAIPGGIAGGYAGGKAGGALYDRISNWWSGKKDASLVQGSSLTSVDKQSDKINALMQQNLNDKNSITADKLEFITTDEIGFKAQEIVLNAEELRFNIDETGNNGGGASNEDTKDDTPPPQSPAPFNPLTSTGEQGGAYVPSGPTTMMNPVTSTVAPAPAPDTSHGTQPFSPLTSTGALPRYEQGTNNVPVSGPAIVGENNKPEIIQGKDGTRIAPAGEHVELLSKGDQVIPAAKAGQRRSGGRFGSVSVSAPSPSTNINVNVTSVPVIPPSVTINQTPTLDVTPTFDSLAPEPMAGKLSPNREPSTVASRQGPSLLSRVESAASGAMSQAQSFASSSIGTLRKYFGTPGGVGPRDRDIVGNIQATDSQLRYQADKEQNAALYASPESAGFWNGSMDNPTRSPSQNERATPVVTDAVRASSQNERISPIVDNMVPLPPRRPKVVHAHHNRHGHHHHHQPQHHHHHSAHHHKKKHHHHKSDNTIDHDHDAHDSSHLLRHVTRAY